MSIPLIILGGGSGSGKDTVASFMVKNHGAIAIAQSGPMKRFCQKVFGFTDEQLWGPSANRNAVDPRNSPTEWQEYFVNFDVYLQVELQALDMREFGEHAWAWFYGVREYCKTHDLTPRYILQTYGTEFGRVCNKDVWIKYANRMADSILGGGCTYTEKEGLAGLSNPNSLAAKWVVITDGRFPNELMAVKSQSGFAIKIDGTDTSQAAQVAGVMGHASETSLAGIPPEWFNYVFRNDKTLGLDACETRVDQLMHMLASPRYL